MSCKNVVATQENQFLRFPTNSDNNQSVQSQKIVRRLKFQIKDFKERLFYLCSEYKGGCVQLLSFV